jgi:hypothetical protein
VLHTKFQLIWPNGFTEDFLLIGQSQTRTSYGSHIEHFFPGIAPLVSILLFPKNIDDFSLLIQKKKPTANSRYTINKIVILYEQLL